MIRFSILVCLLAAGCLKAQNLDQELISSSGESFSTGTLTLDWSLGEPVIATFSAGNRQLTQGFHQTQLFISSLESFDVSADDVLLYPNPNSGALMLDLKDFDKDLRLECYDMLGRLLIGKDYESSTMHTIDMSHFSAGHYVIQLISKKILKTVKIEKL